MEEKLITENINLVYHVLKKYKLYSYLDEYFDIGMIGLVRGAKTYDESKGYKPSTYLTKCIANEIFKYNKTQNYAKRSNGQKDISIYTPIGEDGNECYLMDMIPSDENIEEMIIKQEQLEWLYKELSKIEERDKFIICSYYGLLGYKKLTQIEIAKKVKVSRKTVSLVIKKYIEKLRRNNEKRRII